MSVKELFPGTEPTLYDVIEIMQKGFARMEERFDYQDLRYEELRQEMRGMNHRLSKNELQLEEKGETIQNHEERLTSIERWKRGLGKKGMAGA